MGQLTTQITQHVRTEGKLEKYSGKYLRKEYINDDMSMLQV